MEKQLHGAALSISQLINPFNQVTHEPLPAGHTNIKDPDLFPEVKALGLRPVLLVPVESEGPQIVKFVSSQGQTRPNWLSLLKLTLCWTSRRFGSVSNDLEAVTTGFRCIL